MRCSVRTAEIGVQFGENRNLLPEQAIFGQARTERQTASTPIRLAEAAAIGLEQSGTNQPMVGRLYWASRARTAGIDALLHRSPRVVLSRISGDSRPADFGGRPTISGKP